MSIVIVLIMVLITVIEVFKEQREYKVRLQRELNKKRIETKLENKKLEFEMFKSYINSKPDVPLEENDDNEEDTDEVDEENEDTLVPSVSEFKQIIEFWTRNDVFDDNIRQRIQNYSVNDILSTFYS